MALLIEVVTPDLIKSSVAINENTKEKEYYIQGVFSTFDQKNRNGRVYPKHILEREINNYNNLFVKTNMAFGELDHPQSSTINTERISHRIVEMHWEGSNAFGKAIITDTPMGNIVKGLIGSGGVVGISSRSQGSVKNGIVQEDLSLKTFDTVLNPSNIDSYMQMIREQEDLLLSANVSEQSIDILKNDIKNNRINRKQFNEQLLIRFKQLFTK
jgi:hypothetical protein